MYAARVSAAEHDVVLLVGSSHWGASGAVWCAHVSVRQLIASSLKVGDNENSGVRQVIASTFTVGDNENVGVQVSILYTAPTAIRSLMAKGDEPVKKHKRSSLRILGTVGEPINPEAWRWYYEVSLGCHRLQQRQCARVCVLLTCTAALPEQRWTVSVCACVARPKLAHWAL